MSRTFRRLTLGLLLAVGLALFVIQNAPRGPIGQPVRLHAAGWALLTHTAQGAASSSTVTTSAISTTGATLIVEALGSGGSALVGNFSDSASNTPNYVMLQSKTVSTDACTLLFIFNPTTSASHTFTYAGTNSFPSLAVASFSGSIGGFQVFTAGTSTGSTTVQPGSVTPTMTGALVVTCYTNNLSSGTPTFSINSSFTKTDQIAGGATPSAVALAYLIQSPAAAVNPTWTSTTSTNNIANIAVINGVVTSGGGETSAVISGGS